MPSRIPLKAELCLDSVVYERRRLQVDGASSLEDLQGIARDRWGWAGPQAPVQYVDADRDAVTMTDDADWDECKRLWRDGGRAGGGSLRLRVRCARRVGCAWAEATTEPAFAPFSFAAARAARPARGGAAAPQRETADPAQSPGAFVSTEAKQTTAAGALAPGETMGRAGPMSRVADAIVSTEAEQPLQTAAAPGAPGSAAPAAAAPPVGTQQQLQLRQQQQRREHERLQRQRRQLRQQQRHERQQQWQEQQRQRREQQQHPCGGVRIDAPARPAQGPVGQPQPPAAEVTGALVATETTQALQTEVPTAEAATSDAIAPGETMERENLPQGPIPSAEMIGALVPTETTQTLQTEVPTAEVATSDAIVPERASLTQGSSSPVLTAEVIGAIVSAETTQTLPTAVPIAEVATSDAIVPREVLQGVPADGPGSLANGEAPSESARTEEDETRAGTGPDLFSGQHRHEENTRTALTDGSDSFMHGDVPFEAVCMTGAEDGADSKPSSFSEGLAGSRRRPPARQEDLPAAWSFGPSSLSATETAVSCGSDGFVDLQRAFRPRGQPSYNHPTQRFAVFPPDDDTAPPAVSVALPQPDGLFTPRDAAVAVPAGPSAPPLPAGPASAGPLETDGFFDDDFLESDDSFFMLDSAGDNYESMVSST
ncbi:hypothetical protein DIPPA_08989 [Diplonema papillatum]|nr:hypothetical protein DIPPA_08989 [Diplonema papillatum]